MAFIKVRDIKSKEAAIINTDMICRIAKVKKGYQRTLEQATGKDDRRIR